MQILNNRHCQRTRLWNGKEEETSLKVLQHRLASLKDTTETCLRLRLTEIRIGAATRQTRAWHAGIGHFTRSQWEVTIHMGLPGEIHLDQRVPRSYPPSCSYHIKAKIVWKNLRSILEVLNATSKKNEVVFVLVCVHQIATLLPCAIVLFKCNSDNQM